MLRGLLQLWRLILPPPSPLVVPLTSYLNGVSLSHSLRIVCMSGECRRELWAFQSSKTHTLCPRWRREYQLQPEWKPGATEVPAPTLLCSTVKLVCSFPWRILSFQAEGSCLYQQLIKGPFSLQTQPINFNLLEPLWIITENTSALPSVCGYSL